jgi:endonuclease/exonuclease/phosphatase family metal-dependent hydrolase
MLFRRILLVVGFVVLILFIALYALLSQGSGIPAPVLVNGTASRTPTIMVDSETGIASIEISVLSFNVAGLPWPIACGKHSRQTDAENKRIPIACNRAQAQEKIGDTLGELRQQGIEPDIVLLQEAFIAASSEVADRGGYPGRATGPGRDDTTETTSSRAGASFIEARSFLGGEKFGKRLSAGLLVASNFPIKDRLSAPFYQWECAGFDCLANKGLVLVRLEIPGLPDALEVVTTHYNSKAASGVSLSRTLEAHKLQVASTVEFLEKNSNTSLPAIWGGDLNMRHSDDRIDYFVKRAGEDLFEVSSYCLENKDKCNVDMDWETDRPWYVSQDLQGWADGKRVGVKPIRVEEAFNQPVNGKMPSDHNGLLVTYRLSWSVQND